MILNCIVRLCKDGELIKGTVDTNTGKVSCVPVSVFKFELPSTFYKAIVRNDENSYGRLCRLMLCNRDAVFAVDVGGLGFYYQVDDTIYYCNNELTSEYVLYNIDGYEVVKYVQLGLRPTVTDCLSINPYQFCLSYSTKLDRVITSRGVFDLGNLDINLFNKDMDYLLSSVHSHMIAELNCGNKFALCLYDKTPIWLYTNGVSLKI